MKKKFFAILTALTVLALVMTGCPTPGTTPTPPAKMYTVIFDYNYTGAPAAVEVTVEDGKKIDAADIPDNPTRTDWEFLGWYTVAEETGGELFNPNAAVTRNRTYYARWSQFDAATQVKVYFDQNYTDAPAPALIIATKNTPLGDLFPSAPTREGFVFIGWFTEAGASGGTEFTAADSPGDVEKTVYARWGAAITITYDKNGGVGGTTKEVMGGVGFTIIGSSEANVSKAGSVFKNWNTAADGSGTVYEAGASATFTVDTTLFAQWKEPAAVAAASEIEEEITLGNSWFALYKFTLPDGKTWADYKNGGLVASYKLSQDLLDNGMARAIRVMGNFTDAEVNGTVYTYATTQEMKKNASGTDLEPKYNNADLAAAGPLVDIHNGVQMAAVAQWQGGASGPYILSQMGGAWNDGNMGTELDKLGITPEADEWFQLSYIIDGSKKNGAHDSAKRLPDDTDTGPFYFAVGLPGQNSGNTFGVKNVIMVGTTTGTNDVVGMPLYYKNTQAASNNLYRAYNGQFTKDGGNGTGLAGWKIKSGDESKIVPVEKDLGAAPVIVTITFDMNIPAEFSGTDAPADKTLKIISGERLASGQLAKPELAGYFCTGWFDEATDGNAIEAAGIDKTDLDNPVATGTAFTADTSIYAQWLDFTPNMTPWVIENPAMILRGGANYIVDADDGYIRMATGDINEANGAGAYDSLVCFSFKDDALEAIDGCPADKLGGFLKIKVEYAAENITIPAAGDGEMSVAVKNGVDSYSGPAPGSIPDGYPNLEDTGSFEWNLSAFATPPADKDPGFGLQANTVDHSEHYKIKITKITFSYN